MTNPKYDVGQVVYFRESAALGFLEAVRIGGISLGPNGWLYALNMTMMPPSPGGHQDRRSWVSTQILYYTEDEFVLHYDALVLAEANAKAAYLRVQAQRQAFYPDNPTQG